MNSVYWMCKHFGRSRFDSRRKRNISSTGNWIERANLGEKREILNCKNSAVIRSVLEWKHVKSEWTNEAKPRMNNGKMFDMPPKCPGMLTSKLTGLFGWRQTYRVHHRQKGLDHYTQHNLHKTYSLNLPLRKNDRTSASNPSLSAASTTVNLLTHEWPWNSSKLLALITWRISCFCYSFVFVFTRESWENGKQRSRKKKQLKLSQYLVSFML